MRYEERVRELFTPLRMAVSAADRIRRMSALLCGMRGSSGELYFYLLADSAEGRPATVTAAYVPWGQHVSASACALSLEGKLRSYREIEESGCCLVGWAHSHGELAAFHSETDRGNTLGRCLESEAYALCDTLLDEDEAAALVALSADGRAEGAAEHLVACPASAHVEVVRVEEVAYAYSMTYSVREDRFECAVGVRTPGGECVMLEGIPLDIIEDGEPFLPDDDAALGEELASKVEHGC